MYCPASYNNEEANQLTRQAENQVSNEIGNSLYEASGLGDAIRTAQSLVRGDFSGAAQRAREAVVNITSRGLTRALQHVVSACSFASGTPVITNADQTY